MSETEYIKRCREGDNEAFGELVSLYENKILNYCYRMLGNRTDAEDATQEVFVKLYRFLGSFTGQSAFSTWLYKIASNVCLDFLRKSKKQKTVPRASSHFNPSKNRLFRDGFILFCIRIGIYYII